MCRLLGAVAVCPDCWLAVWSWKNLTSWISHKLDLVVCSQSGDIYCSKFGVEIDIKIFRHLKCQVSDLDNFILLISFTYLHFPLF